ncbi:MAG: regulatory protein RecX [Acidobacteriota bacterium]|nr:regulatory protein RecX [Acidobacteriota bacterium]MDE3260360.1 regulatory protein RecX [Acidobacteriota bacterium]
MKLLAREFGEPEVEETISRLRERRYLDDRSLAEAVARTQARTRHQGPLKVRAHLRRRLIPDALALEAIRAEFPEGAEAQRAVIALRRLQPVPAASRDGGLDGAISPAERRKEAGRLFRRLVARGYSGEAARHAVLSAERPLEQERHPELGT